MTSNLIVPLFCRGAIFQAGCLQNRVLAEFLLDAQYRFLDSPFFLQGGIFLLRRLLQSRIVGEEVQLLGNFLLFYGALLHQLVGADGDTPDGELRVHAFLI